MPTEILGPPIKLASNVVGAQTTDLAWKTESLEPIRVWIGKLKGSYLLLYKQHNLMLWSLTTPEERGVNVRRVLHTKSRRKSCCYNKRICSYQNLSIQFLSVIISFFVLVQDNTLITFIVDSSRCCLVFVRDFIDRVESLKRRVER